MGPQEAINTIPWLLQELDFRPSKVQVDAAVRAVSLVLCNDKITTYGAPDVLQVSIDQLDGHFCKHHSFSDRPPNQAMNPSLPVGTGPLGH